MKNAFVSFTSGPISWIGEILLIFGAYDAFSGGGILLIGFGFALVCFGEGMNLIKKMKKAEIELLHDNIIKNMLRNMAFPLLWMLIFFATGMEILLALSIATGVKAIVKNSRIAATFYMTS
ncbi:MAG: hypothetical protein GY852_01795 [bacterium]|nr:hypothetical protein [bacterium]